MASLKTFSPDIRVSDLGMPKQDGYDLIRHVREAGWSAETLPAIALTAFASAADRSSALSAGYQSFLSKPIDVPLFVAEVRRLIDRRR